MKQSLITTVVIAVALIAVVFSVLIGGVQAQVGYPVLPTGYYYWAGIMDGADAESRSRYVVGTASCSSSMMCAGEGTNDGYRDISGRATFTLPVGIVGYIAKVRFYDYSPKGGQYNGYGTGNQDDQYYRYAEAVPENEYTACHFSDAIWAAGIGSFECDVLVVGGLPGVMVVVNQGSWQSNPFNWGVEIISLHLIKDSEVSGPGDTQPVGGTGCTWVVTSTGESFASSTNAILNPSFEEGSGVPAEWRFPDGFSGWNYLENDADLANDGVKSVVYDQYLAGLGASSLAIDINLPDEYVITTVSVPYRLGECMVGADCENGRSLSVHIGSIPVVNEIVNYDDCALLGDDLGGYYHSCGYRGLEADVDAYAGFYTFRIDIGSGSAPIWIDGVSVQASDGIAFLCIEPTELLPEPTATPLGTAQPLPTMAPLATMGPMPTIGPIMPTPVDPFVDFDTRPTRCITVWPETAILSDTLPYLNVCIAPYELGLGDNPVDIITDGAMQNTIWTLFTSFLFVAIVGWVRFR